MIRLALIAIFSVLIANSIFAQQTSVDTLYTGLKKATSFLIANEAIYVVEQGNHRILKLSLDGKLIEKHGNRGNGNYQFDNPVDIASSTGLKIFVSDAGNNRIQVFDKRGQYLSSIKGNEKFRTNATISPEHIGINKLGEIFFYDSRSKSLGKYNEDGAYLDQIPIPTDIKSVSGLQISGSKIFLLDTKSDLIHQISDNGFYESFYKAEKATAFYSKEEEIYIAQSHFLKRSSKEGIKNLYKFKPESDVKKILVIENEVYILADNYLLKLILSR
jgi:ribosomal protein L35AE/L33A